MSSIKKRLFKTFMRFLPKKIHKKIFKLSTIFYCFYENFNYNFEENGEFWLLNSITKCSDQIFLDVGANTGEYSLKIRQLFPKSRIYSFEPSPKTYEKLVENTKSFKNIFPKKIGLSKEPKTAVLYEYLPYSGRNTLNGFSTGLQYSDRYSIEVSTGDIFLKEISFKGNISLLKIDVEGHELDVLKGFLETLGNKKIEIIQFERATAANTDRIYDFYNFLIPLGYKLGKLFPNFIEIYENYNCTLDEYIGSNWIAINSTSDFIKKFSNHIKTFDYGARKLIDFRE